jgi:hypothetical protein
MVVSIVYFWLQSVSKERGEFLRLVKNEVMQAPSAVFSLSNYEVCGQKLFADSSDTMTQVAMHLTFTMLCHQMRVFSLSLTVVIGFLHVFFSEVSMRLALHLFSLFLCLSLSQKLL